MTTSILSTTPDSEIVSIRIFHAPIETVFRAWTEPAHLAKWWGPAGFTNTFFEYDLRVGGRWKFIMHGPEKGNYPNEVEFIKIEAPSLIAWDRISQPYFQVLVTFEKLSEDATKVIFKMLFKTPEECAKIKKFAVDKNEENFDKLEIELKQMVDQKKNNFY